MINKRQHNILFIFILGFVLLFTAINTQAQTFIIHKVQKGETLEDIAQHYHISPTDILRYNADVQSNGVLETGQPLLIPNEETVNQFKERIKLTGKIVDYKYHTVGENETLFSLAKQYNSNIESIVQLNNVEGTNIKLGQILIIPVFEVENAPRQIDESKYTYYEVKPKEGKWRVAYDHGITMDELERLNPEIKNQTLKIGQKLVVPKFLTTNAPKRDDEHYIYYEVQPKETMYSLSKRFGISIDEMLSLNPELKEGLKAGQTIRFPRTVPETPVVNKKPPVDFEEKIKELRQPVDSLIYKQATTDLDTIKYNRPFQINLLDSMRLDKTYKLAVLLPFKIKHFDTLSGEDVCDKLINNKILDYYSGIKFAIDSLQHLGMHVQYDVFDTQASPYVTGKILEVTDLSDYDFVIGPVKKENIEKVTHILEFDNTPVAVHNYKGDQHFRNIVVTTSDNQAAQQHMLNYLREKAENKAISLIFDPTQKKDAEIIAKQLGDKTILIEGKETKKGYSISLDNINKKLSKDKENYVLLLSDDDSFIFSVLSTLNALRNSKKITLFTLKDKKLYEDDTNDRMNMFLANLNYHFPAKMLRLVNRQLAKSYKAKYHILPSFTAINGFDTTFDLLVRAANADNLFEGLQKIGRTQQSSKVYLYSHTPNTGFHNQGTVILRINPTLELDKVE